MQPGAMASRRWFFLTCGVVMLVLLLFVFNQSPFNMSPAKSSLVSFWSPIPNSSLVNKLAEVFASTMTNATETIGNFFTPPQPSRPKIILWDPVVYWLKIPEGGEMFSKCEVSSCVFVTNRAKAKELGTPDAVLISGDHMPPQPRMEKAKGQLWVYFTHESPVTLTEFNKAYWNNSAWRDKLDMAMVYRPDAQFPIPYAVVERTARPPPPRNYSQLLARKTKLAAQVSTNHCSCQSKRGDYVRLLQKHAPVDVFGGCGPLKCQGQKCFDLINQNYRFYLAFENSLCSGYVTEKFFRTYLWDVVPVVRGNANYSRLFPRDSYVDTRDFRSPKALAEFLLQLQRNDTAYTRMLKAKEGYTMGASSFQRAYCQLCQFLHSPNPTPDPNFHFARWWSVEESCVPPKDLVDE